MSVQTPAEHRIEAQRLMNEANYLRRLANNPDVAGGGIREDWRKQADSLMDRAQVHASLGVDPPPAPLSQVKSVPFAMIRVDQGGGDLEWVRVDQIESLKAVEDKLQYICLKSGRMVDATGSLAAFMEQMGDALVEGAEILNA